MATYRIPNQGFIRQLNNGDTAGELWSTWNIDLHTNPGKIKLARPLKQVATSAQIGNDDIQAFAVLGNDAYALTAGALYSAQQPFTSWSSESTDPQNAEDMVVFKGQLVITTNNNLDAYDGSSYTSDWWTARGNPSLTNNNPIVLAPRVLEVARIGSETLVVTDGSNVHAYTGAIGSGSGTSVTVDLDASFTSTCFKSSIRRGWIGTYTEDGEQAYIFEWDVASTNYTQSYPVGAKAVLSMELIDDAPIIVTERGEIKFFNGAGFRTVAQFPFATKPLFAEGVETGAVDANNLSRPIHPKGMKRSGNTLFINAAFKRTDADLPLDERSHGGIWALDLSNQAAELWSLTHLTSPQNNQAFAASSPIMVVNDSSGRIFIGGRLITASSSDNGIWMEDLSASSSQYGYFVTSEIESGNIKDTFSGIIAKALLGSDTSVRAKYRTSNDPSLPVVVSDMAWASTTKLNSTSSSLATVKSRYDAGHRDEVEIVLGAGAGRLAHITSVEKSASTYSITIDEAIGMAGQLATVRFDNWKKIDKSMEYGGGEVESFGTGGESSGWGQYKVELRGKSGHPTIRGIVLPTTAKEKLN